MCLVAVADSFPPEALELQELHKLLAYFVSTG